MVAASPRSGKRLRRTVPRTFGPASLCFLALGSSLACGDDGGAAPGPGPTAGAAGAAGQLAAGRGGSSGIAGVAGSGIAGSGGNVSAGSGGNLAAGSGGGVSAGNAGSTAAGAPGCPPPAPTMLPADPALVSPAVDPALAKEKHAYFTITVRDAASKAALPGALVETTNHVVFRADKHGVVAFYEPGLMGKDVYFRVTRPGYEQAKDGFGLRGKALRADEGAQGELLLTKIGDETVTETSDLASRLAAAPVRGADGCFALRVVDKVGRRGVPLVEVKVASTSSFTDSQGLVAFCDPDQLGKSLTFSFSSHGYAPLTTPALTAAPGKEQTVEIERTNVAERLYRVTGGGIYRDSVILGRKTPLAHPVIEGLVHGQDTVAATRYQGKLFWIWGDTNRPAYALGNFRASGARSELPSAGGLDPRAGVDLTYIVDANGFSRPVTEVLAPENAPTWLGSLIAVPDAKGTSRLFATFVKPDAKLAITRAGLARFDDEAQLFRQVLDYPLDRRPSGQPVGVRSAAGKHVVFEGPFRIRETAEAFVDVDDYEIFTARTEATGQKLAQHPDGTLAYAWKKGLPAVTGADLTAGKIAPDQALEGRLRDIETGGNVPIAAHGVAWNAHRQRYVRTVQQFGGTTSPFGEMWFAEADTPLGPWGYARKIVTHDDYTFYNPWLHPHFDQEGGRFVFFEATYTKALSKTPLPLTPRYDYNQVMYRLDLDDPRLSLPVAVYDASPNGSGAFGTRRDLLGRTEPVAAAFFAREAAASGFIGLAWSGPACEPRRLVPAESSALPVAFYVAKEATSTKLATVPLYEHLGPGATYTYGLSATAQPGESPPSNIGYVFEAPVRARLPVGDSLGDLVALAGADQCVPAGTKVVLDATKSVSRFGEIASYTWRENHCTLATTAQATLVLSPGLHVLELEVRTAEGARSRDSLVVRVGPQ